MVDINQVTVKSILTRTTGFLKTVTSHSLQPYNGCTFGNALCGVGCYVQHNVYLTRGRPWGSYLEVRTNAAAVYAQHYAREQVWGRTHCGAFSVFMSSSTDPFLPQEECFGITRRLLQRMVELPPDGLIVQTHTHRVTHYVELYPALQAVTDLRFHISIESDRDRLPGLPPPASSVEKRLQAATTLKQAGLRVIVIVAPLLPIEQPQAFFERIAAVADGVVFDHFILGDGSRAGQRTLRTALPQAIGQVHPQALHLDYRDQMVALARTIMPGRVGVHIDGFAGQFQ